MKKMKLTARELARLTNEGVLKPRIDGSVQSAMAAPKTNKDNKKRSWKVGDIERDWDGFITSLVISEE